MIDRPLYYNAETEKWFERYLACIKRIEAAEKCIEELYEATQFTNSDFHGRKIKAEYDRARMRGRDDAGRA